MKHYTTQLLPEPVSVPWPGRRPVKLTALVLEDGRPYGAFERETAAAAYAARLNKLEKEALCQS